LGQENYQKSVFKTQQKEGFATSSTPANNFWKIIKNTVP
jgi:hypothetical protein